MFAGYQLNGQRHAAEFSIEAETDEHYLNGGEDDIYPIFLGILCTAYGPCCAEGEKPPCHVWLQAGLESQKYGDL